VNDRPPVPAAVRRHVFFLVSFLFVCSAALPAAGDDPRDWLRRMTEAVEFRNYQGTLVHSSGSSAGVLNIVHRVENGRVTERITAQDGMAREIIRNDDEVTCILPDQQSVLVTKRDERDTKTSPLRGRLPSASSVSERHYALEMIGAGRAAGREAVIITVRPRDSYRYGYRLWLDQVTAMPLKSQLWDNKDKVIEQIMFSSISLPETIPADAIEPSLETDDFTWHRSGDADNGQLEDMPGWEAAELPDGFQLIAARSKQPPGAGSAMEQLVYADGLALVSVFVEADAAASEPVKGLSRIGAASAFTTSKNGWLITAVGEVPARTVEMIASSIRPLR